MLSRAPPSRPNIFFGRDDYVNKAVKEITSKHPVRFAILGPGGIGKTFVVEAIIDDDVIVDVFDEHRYFIACDTFPDANNMVAAIYQIVIGPSSPSQLPSLKDLIKYLKSLPKTLLVLDNFETMWDVDNQNNIKHVMTKLFGIKTLSLLLTMRGATPPETFRWSLLDLDMQLPALDMKSAKETFLATCPSWADDSFDADLSEVVSRLDRVPLAVFIVASVASMTEQTSTRILEDISKHLETHRNDRFNSIKTSVSLSLNTFTIKSNPRYLELLKIIAYLIGGAAVSILKSITSTSDCEKFLDILVKFGLAYRMGPGRYNVLSPVRHYILEDYNIGPSSSVREDIYGVFFELCKKGPDTLKSLVVRESLTVEKDNCIKVLSDALISYKKDYACLQAIHDFSTFLLYTAPSKNLLQLAEGQIQHCENLYLKAICLQCSGEISRMLSNNIEARTLISQAKTELEGVGDRLGSAQC